MSEELKGQLAERMPGVISAMAEAAGFGKGDDAAAKLMDAMQKGKVKSKAVLEQFAAILAKRVEGDPLEAAKKSTAAQQGRFNNSFSDAVKVFSEAGFDKAMSNFFKEAASAITRAEPMIRGLGNAFDYVMIPVRMLVRLAGDLGSHIDELASYFGTTSEKLTLFSAGALLAMTPLGRMLEVITGVVLILEDFVTYLEDGESVFGEWMASLSPEKAETIRQMGYELKQLGESVKIFAEMGKDIFEGIFAFWGPDGASNYAINSVTRMAGALNDLAAAYKAFKGGDTEKVKEISQNMAGNNAVVTGWKLFSNFGNKDKAGDTAAMLANFLDGRGYTTKREEEERNARKESYPTTQPSPLLPQPATPSVPTSPENSTQPTQLVVHGNLVLDMPGVTGNPTDIEKAVNQVLHKAVRSINSNQTEGEQ